MQISIKPICDWPIYLTASADERLACITHTSFHCTTWFMNPFLAIDRNKDKEARQNARSVAKEWQNISPIMKYLMN